MVDAEPKPQRRVRLGVALLVAALHVIAVAVLVRAFAPQLGATILRPVTQAFDVTVTPDPPPPEPKPTPSAPAARASAPAAPAGRKAQPREVAAPAAKLILPRVPAPPVAASGSADAAGAAERGEGTGAGGAGQGLGAGGTGTGNGGGNAKAVKIAGDIVSARDYPRKTREARLGSAVTVALTVGADGRVNGCRILRPSRDAEADRITCRLATERFRFRPARDAAGHPVPSTYGWQQRWFTPERD